MAANNVEEPHMGASHDKLPDSSAASLDACSVTRNSTSTVGKLEYFKGVSEPSTTPLTADRNAVEQLESLQSCDSSSAVASTPQDSEVLRELPAALPTEDSPALEPPSSPNTGRKWSGGWIKYTECQKAFILHHGRDCSWEDVATKFEAQFGTDRPVDRVKLVKLRRYLVKTKQEQTLLNDATTYDWYAAVPAKNDAKDEEQIRSLANCSEEQQAFLVYHTIKRLTYLRIVEVFNEQFGTALGLDVIEGLLLASRRNGNEPHLLLAAARYDWYKKYLTKRAPPGEKAAGPLWIGKKIESSNPGLESEQSDSDEPKPKVKTVPTNKQTFSHEQLSYLAWLSRRIRYKERIMEAFRARFGDYPDEWKVRQQMKRFRRNPDAVDTFLDGVESYEWYQPDFKSHEVGYNGQELLRVRTEARRRLRMGINRFAPPADGSSPTVQSQASLSSPSGLSPENPAIKREYLGRNGVSPLRESVSSPTSATPAVSRISPKASHPRTADTKDDDSPEILFARPVAAAPRPRDVNGVQPMLARPTGGFEGLRRTEPLQHRSVVGEKRRTDSAPTSGGETPRKSPYIPGLRRAAMPTTVATNKPASANGPSPATTAPPGLPNDFVEEGFEPLSYGDSVLHTQGLQGNNTFRSEGNMQYPRHNAIESGYREPRAPVDQSSANAFGRNQEAPVPLYGLNEGLGGSSSHYHDSNYYPMALPPSHQPLQHHALGGYQSTSSRTTSSTQYFGSHTHSSTPSLQSQSTTYARPYSQPRPAQQDYSPLVDPRQNVSPYEAASYAMSNGHHNSHPSPWSHHWEAGYESRPREAHVQQDHRPPGNHQVNYQQSHPAQYHAQSQPQHPLQYGRLSNYGSEPSNVYGTMQQQDRPAQHQPRRHHPHGLSQHNLPQYQPPSIMQQQRTPAHEGFTSAMLRRRATRNAVGSGSVSQGSQRSASPDKAERNRRQDFW